MIVSRSRTSRRMGIKYEAMRIAWGIYLAVAGSLLAQTPNTLTPEEKAAGWKLLFDGKSMKGWIDPGQKTPPGTSWTIEDNCLKARAKPNYDEDLITRERFRDFELAWEWKISPRGNSGVKYLIQDLIFLDLSKLPKEMRFEQKMGEELSKHLSHRDKIAPDAKGQEYVVGFEYQMTDNDANPDAKSKATHASGALYDMVPASNVQLKPVGEFNQSRLVLRGDHVEHWLNGVKVVDTSLTNPAVADSVNKRWGPAPALAKMLLERPRKDCPISLQNHGDDAWFRSIKIRRLK